jgi:hypothetical protein
MKLFYTGVGSRKTPEPILVIMNKLALKLEHLGYWLRSGGADGADQAFAFDIVNREIYRPEHARNNKQASTIAQSFHPAWDKLSDYVKLLHARNAFQVLGYSLDVPSSFLVCWTSDGACTHEERSIETGGTGTAISIADSNGIPVFNLARPNHMERILDFKTEILDNSKEFIARQDNQCFHQGYFSFK